MLPEILYIRRTFACVALSAISGPKKVVPVIIEGLRKLEYRGYDSAGIAVVDAAGKLHLRRAPGKLRNPGRSHSQFAN